MYNTACVVNLYLPPPSSNPSSTPPDPPTGTCCGILVDSQQGLVLAHASCLGPFLETGDLDLATLTSTLKEDRSRLSCEVLLQKEEGWDGSAARVSGVPVSTLLHTDISFSHIDILHGRDATEKRSTAAAQAFHRFPATLVQLFHCPEVRESLQQLMPESSWDFLDSKDENNSSRSSSSSSSVTSAEAKDMAQSLLSSFIIARLHKWKPYRSSLLVRPTRDCAVGERVEICSTPFAGLKPQAFINSHSRGIISNLAGKDNCLLLSDARCILGGEGAPLYTFQRGRDLVSSTVRCVTGVVVASLCWKNQEWVGFCVAADIGTVVRSANPHLQRLLKGHPRSRSLPGAVRRGSALLPQGVNCPEVVMVRVGATWGSGVVVEAESGLILTCSHVIKEAHLYPVEVQRGGEEGEGVRRGKTRVLYRQHPVRRQFDLALVQSSLPPPLNTPTPLTPSLTPVSIAAPEQGMEVFVVGHALFGPEHRLPPSVTSGVISKVIKVNQVPVMIQTTCAVHPGDSGGALVDIRGHLVAIVVCNTRDNSSGASFPHVNMSIPACTVWPVIARYLRTRDISHLEKLRLQNREVDTVWSLESLQDTGMSPKASKL